MYGKNIQKVITNRYLCDIAMFLLHLNCSGCLNVKYVEAKIHDLMTYNVRNAVRRYSDVLCCYYFVVIFKNVSFSVLK
jgi:hypothetical protein